MNKTLTIVVALMFVTAIASSFYTFAYSKNYNFLLETSCDPATHNCFVRDCNSEDGCPTNNYDHYRVFNMLAKDYYSYCSASESLCIEKCESGTMSCVETKCGESTDDICSSAKQ